MMSANVHDEEFLLQNVQDLRQRLQLTEQSLQTINSIEARNQRPRRDASPSRHISTGFHHLKQDPQSNRSSPAPDMLTIEDLTPENTTRGNDLMARAQDFSSEITMHSSPLLSAPIEKKSASKSGGGAKQSLQFNECSDFEYENETLRLKLQQLRDENSQLIMQNHKLLNHMETIGYERRQSDIKSQSAGVELTNANAKMKELQERMKCLEAENKTNLESLRDAEEKFELTQKQMDERDEEIEKVRDEFQSLNEELDEMYRQKKRAEQDRDFALQSAEEIQDSYEDFQQKAEERFQKFRAHEEHLALRAEAAQAESGAGKEEINSAKALIDTLQGDIRTFQNENVTQKSNISALEQQNEELRSRLTSNSHKLGKLEVEAKTHRALARENGELKKVVEQQKLKLEQCRIDIGESRAHLTQLTQLAQKLQEKAKTSRDSGVSSKGTQINISGATQDTFEMDGSYLQNFSGDENKSQVLELKKKMALAESEVLHLRELLDRRKSDEVPPTALENLKRELKSMTERSKMAEIREDELEKIIKKLEEDRKKHTSQLVALEEKVAEYEVNSSSLDTRLSHRSSQVSELQNELTERSNQMNTLERELRKRNSQLSSLERQLDEKVLEITEQIAKVSELEEELQVKAAQSQRTRIEYEEKVNALIQQTAMVDKIKQLHAEQCHEMERQIEILDRRSTARESKFTDMERKLTTAEQLLDSKETVLTETRMELERIRSESERSVKRLEAKAREAGENVSHLQSALTVCQEELKVYLDQLDETRNTYESQLGEKTREVEKLSRQLTEARKATQSKCTKLLELERSVSERQDMLHQSNNRVSELEETQGKLQIEVSRLEQELHREKTALGTELSNTNGKLHQACADLELRERELISMKSKYSAIQEEKEQLSDQVLYLEEQLQEEGRELAAQGDKTRETERELRNLRSRLRDKEETVKDLEDSIERQKEELQEKFQKCKQLQEELQKAQSEILIYGSKVSEYEQSVKSVEHDVKQRNDQVEILQQTVRRNQDEIRSRNQEIEDLNVALKERQWELQQRASQITQLDMTINEYRAEMEQKMIRMEASLKKAQLEGQQRTNQVSCLDGNLVQLQTDIQDKNLQLQQSELTCRKYKGDLDIANQQIDQLNQQIEAIHRQLENIHSSSDDMESELKHSREELLRIHHELTECRRELSMSKREQDKLIRDVEEANSSLKIKDMELKKLSEQLGILRAKEEQLDLKYVNELKLLRQEIDTLQEEHEQEVNEIQEAHNRVVSSKEDVGTVHRVKMQEIRDKEAIYRSQLEKANSLIAGLEADLSACKGTIDAANEAIILKDAELARIQTKFSSYQRAALTNDTTHLTNPSNSPPKQTLESQNNSLSTGSITSSSYLSRMSFVKFQRNPPPVEQAPPPPQQQFGGHHVSFQEPAHQQPTQVFPTNPGSLTDKMHMQYLNMKLDNMKDLVDDTSQLTMPQSHGHLSGQTRNVHRHEEAFMPLISDTSNASSLGGNQQYLNKTEEAQFSIPVPVIPAFTKSHPPMGVVKPKTNYTPVVQKPPNALPTTQATGLPATGFLGALDLSGAHPSDPDSLLGMLKEIKKSTTSANSTLNSTSASMGFRKGKVAKSRLLEPTASFKAKSVAAAENLKRQERLEKLGIARHKAGLSKQAGKSTKGGHKIGAYGMYHSGLVVPAPEKPKIDPTKSKKSSPKYPDKEHILNVSTAMEHYGTNNNNYLIETDSAQNRNEQSFTHDGSSPFKSYPAATRRESADALLLQTGSENHGNESTELPRLSRSQSYPDALDISAITDDSSKNVVGLDSVNLSQPGGPRMSTANNTQIGGVSDQNINNTDTASCMAQLQIRRLAVQQRQSELNSQLAAADAQLEHSLN